MDTQNKFKRCDKSIDDRKRVLSDDNMKHQIGQFNIYSSIYKV